MKKLILLAVLALTLAAGSVFAAEWHTLTIIDDIYFGPEYNSVKVYALSTSNNKYNIYEFVYGPEGSQTEITPNARAIMSLFINAKSLGLTVKVLADVDNAEQGAYFGTTSVDYYEITQVVID